METLRKASVLLGLILLPVALHYLLSMLDLSFGLGSLFAALPWIVGGWFFWRFAGGCGSRGGGRHGARGGCCGRRIRI